MTGAERQKAYRDKMQAAGFVQVNVYVPSSAVADIQRAAEIMRQHPEKSLTVSRLSDATTGRLVGLKNPKL